MKKELKHCPLLLSTVLLIANNELGDILNNVCLTLDH